MSTYTCTCALIVHHVMSCHVSTTLVPGSPIFQQTHDATQYRPAAGAGVGAPSRSRSPTPRSAPPPVPGWAGVGCCMSKLSRSRRAPSPEEAGAEAGATGAALGSPPPNRSNKADSWLWPTCVSIIIIKKCRFNSGLPYSKSEVLKAGNILQPFLNVLLSCRIVM